MFNPWTDLSTPTILRSTCYASTFSSLIDKTSERGVLIDEAKTKAESEFDVMMTERRGVGFKPSNRRRTKGGAEEEAESASVKGFDMICSSVGDERRPDLTGIFKNWKNEDAEEKEGSDNACKARIDFAFEGEVSILGFCEL